jgi:hypothetical protein
MGVHPMIEKYPLDRVAEAYEQMHSGRVRFRAVLTFRRVKIRNDAFFAECGKTYQPQRRSAGIDSAMLTKRSS